MIKNMKFITLIIFCLVLFDQSLSEGVDGINWHSHDEGLALATQEQKKMFVHFYADWCAYCRKMAKVTFKDPAVVDYLNNYFIPVRVNSDHNRELARKYYIRGLPSTWFVTETGEKISSLPGYIDAKMLMNALIFIHTNNYQKMSFKDFIKAR